jgi:hypothetical protein
MLLEQVRFDCLSMACHQHVNIRFSLCGILSSFVNALAFSVLPLGVRVLWATLGDEVVGDNRFPYFGIYTGRVKEDCEFVLIAFCIRLEVTSNSLLPCILTWCLVAGLVVCHSGRIH